MEMALADTIFDVVIVGGGPAGYTCAIRAGQYGLKVALIEKTDKLGGTCLHWGCIPTKAMLFSAEIWDHIKHASNYGIDNVDAPKLNWENVLKRKTDITLKHAKGLDFLMKKNKITVFNGHGRLTGPAKDGVFTISVSDEDKGKPKDAQAEGFTRQTVTEVKAKKVVLATGSDARMLPGYTADDTILTNMQIRSSSSDRVPLASSSRRSSRASAQRSRSSKPCRASCRWRTRKSRRSCSVSIRSAASRCTPAPRSKRLRR